MNEISKPKKVELTIQNILWRITLIVIQLILVYCLAGEFQPFFYQAF